MGLARSLRRRQNPAHGDRAVEHEHPTAPHSTPSGRGATSVCWPKLPTVSRLGAAARCGRRGRGLGCHLARPNRLYAGRSPVGDGIGWLASIVSAWLHGHLPLRCEYRCPFWDAWRVSRSGTGPHHAHWPRHPSHGGRRPDIADNKLGPDRSGLGRGCSGHRFVQDQNAPATSEEISRHVQ